MYIQGLFCERFIKIHPWFMRNFADSVDFKNEILNQDLVQFVNAQNMCCGSFSASTTIIVKFTKL